MAGDRVPSAARRAWDWRKAWGGWTLATDHGEHGRLFHAYDVNDSAACDPPIGLARSCEPVNEGSHLCPDCMTIVRRQPQGRPEREYADAD